MVDISSLYHGKTEFPFVPPDQLQLLRVCLIPPFRHNLRPNALFLSHVCAFPVIRSLNRIRFKGLSQSQLLTSKKMHDFPAKVCHKQACACTSLTNKNGTDMRTNPRRSRTLADRSDADGKKGNPRSCLMQCRNMQKRNKRKRVNLLPRESAIVAKMAQSRPSVRSE